MLEIKRMQPDDIADVAKIEADTFSDPWSEQGFADALAFDANLFLVAKEGPFGDMKTVGYAGLYVSLDEGEITNVAVAESHKRQGIAKGLLKVMIAQAKDAGINTIFLEVRVSNEPAILLYEGLGFKKVGIRKGFYEFPKEDAHVMRLDVNAARPCCCG